MLLKKKKSPNHQMPPPAVRPKLGFNSMRIPKKLTQSQALLTAQAAAPAALGGKVAGQAAALKVARDALVAAVAARVGLSDEIIVRDAAIATAAGAVDLALTDYTLAGVAVAGGDAAALTSLGVQTVSKPVKQAGPPGAPVNLRLIAGLLLGSLLARHSRPLGAAGFQLEYKLEPSLPTDPWIAPDALFSKGVSQEILGLPQAQLVRVRVRALGMSWGAYSAEVVGRAA